MFSKIISGGIHGMESYLAQVEVDTSQALPGFDMVGLLSGEVREARERVRIALKNAGFRLPPTRITVNISPAVIRKEGSAFDLAIALGILQSLEKIPPGCLADTMVIGELGLDGEVKGVAGVLPMVRRAARENIKRCLLPGENGMEGAVTEGITVIGVKSLQQAVEYLRKPKGEAEQMLPPVAVDTERLLRLGEDGELPDFADIRGQEWVKRAAAIAAAGFHHLLIIGVPGSGKTMIARCMPSILPSMSLEESLEVTSVYSVAGLLKEGKPLITTRPFFNPHHTISAKALAGGGAIPRPGVLSLSHRGILFLDEFPEFSKETIEVLRQPLEEKKVKIARSYGSVTYPADILLVAAMNPCPCGFYPDYTKCSCSQSQIRRYRSRISGPIMDRMDLCVEARAIPIQTLQKKDRSESSRKIRSRVMQAREVQRRRYHGTSVYGNGHLTAGDMETYCALGEKETAYMESVFGALNLSARGYHRILRVARTIADLEGSDRIQTAHLSEAVCFRGWEG